uniref:Uncharacterized protein n=1 Tax=Hyaloperonospora arabidopsidis (strain Emoy2) TaxID=559515 RepID=M4BPX8_HYAAE
MAISSLFEFGRALSSGLLPTASPAKRTVRARSAKPVGVFDSFFIIGGEELESDVGVAPSHANEGLCGLPLTRMMMSIRILPAPVLARSCSASTRQLVLDGYWSGHYHYWSGHCLAYLYR